MAAESRFAEVLDEYLSSLLHKSIPKSTKKSTKYGMKIFNGLEEELLIIQSNLYLAVTLRNELTDRLIEISQNVV